MKELILFVLAYFIGSIPTSILISKQFFNIDIREYGSGNAGATNTFRTLGSKWGIFVMIFDMMKGLCAIKLAFLIPDQIPNEIWFINLQIGLGLAAVLGHIFPIWADFRGGKGVATLFGMVLGIQPNVAIVCAGVFVAVLFLTRYVSLSSILASIAFPVFILVIFKEPEPLYRLFAFSVALMVILTHQKNIGRLFNGSENKLPIFKKKKDEE